MITSRCEQILTNVDVKAQMISAKYMYVHLSGHRLRRFSLQSHTSELEALKLTMFVVYQ